MNTTSLDLAKHTFSRHGSYLAINDDPGDQWNPPGIYLRHVAGTISQPRRLFRITLHAAANGAELTAQPELLPEKLTLATDAGTAEFCIQTNATLRVRTRGDIVLRLRLNFAKGIWQDAYSRAIPVAGGKWDLECFTVGRRIRLTRLDGAVIADAPWNGKMRSEFMQVELRGDAEAALTLFEGPYDSASDATTQIPFDTAADAVRAEFDTWRAAYPAAPEPFADAAFAAAYVGWSCVAAPCGYIKTPAMLMSKRSMPSVWSWDHCFNAIAHAVSHPGFAWDQLAIPFHNQHASGLLADYVNPAELNWMCTKPPVHGWALTEMLRRNPALLTAERAAWMYPKLAAWTNYWLDRANDIEALAGLPHYRHGNDSGWDNATVFTTTPCAASPDLTAFLILQCDALAMLATHLGNTDEANAWQKKSGALQHLLVSEFWKDNRFIALSAHNRTPIFSNSLLLCLPLVLGKKLPQEIRTALVQKLREDFVTDFGVCTESMKSALFCREGYDGYWRGPIWAPPTLMLTLALRDTGETQLAQKIARGFLQLCRGADFAENYDPVTGAGLCDRPYTWTSSVFLTLLSDTSLGV